MIYLLIWLRLDCPRNFESSEPHTRTGLVWVPSFMLVGSETPNRLTKTP